MEKTLKISINSHLTTEAAAKEFLERNGFIVHKINYDGKDFKIWYEIMNPNSTV